MPDLTDREKFIYLCKAYLKEAKMEVLRWEGHLEEFGCFKKSTSSTSEHLTLDEWSEKNCPGLSDEIKCHLEECFDVHPDSKGADIFIRCSMTSIRQSFKNEIMR